MDKIKNINKYFFVWAGVCLAYILFIGYLTWAYPYGADEMICKTIEIKKFILHPNMAIRVGFLINLFFLQFDKVFFVILNPIIHFFVLISVFYLIYMRFPRFDSLQDFPPFILILVLGTFFIAKPGETILWIGGATSYAWVFPAFIWFLIYLRKLEEGTVFKSKYVPFLCLIFGVILGFMNENNSPMVLCLMIAFAVYAHFKKIILRKDFWLLMIVVAISVFIFFKFSGNNIRLNKLFFGFPMQHTLAEKLFMHLPHMDNFAEANLWLIYLLPFSFLILYREKKKIVLQDKNFYLSVIFWLVAFGVSIVLCEAPLVATRAFYSASWFCIISFIFILLEIEKLYKLRLIKYFALLFAIIFLYIAPLFAFQVNFLNDRLGYRQYFIENAKNNNRKKVYVWRIENLRLLPENMTLGYYDCIEEKGLWSILEGIEIENKDGNNTFFR